MISNPILYACLHKAELELLRQVEVQWCSCWCGDVERKVSRAADSTCYWSLGTIFNYSGSTGSCSSNWHRQQPSTASCPAPGPPPRMLGHALVTSTIYAVVQHRAGRLTSHVLDIKYSTFCPILSCIPYQLSIYRNVFKLSMYVCMYSL